MSAATSQLPEGRYGRSADADARTDRRLKVIGAVLGALTLVLLVWIGWDKIAGTEVSGQVITFQVVSDHEVQVHLEVRKNTDTEAVCTLRSVAEDHSEVGRRDVRLNQHSDRIDTVATIRTTSRGTSAELIGCQPTH
ncbi:MULTISPECIES: DUF4307 domain-containing protein [unclassified Streptomyces]|uniref:DUF4307 domain-containing protein n=1 Tax=unclassified Streptomyces TaxID=2593676 RepID=UPI0037F60EFC